jgi:hypothetical protein
MIYVIGSIYAAIMALVWIGMRGRVRLLSGLFSLLSKLRPLRAWTERRRGAAVQIEDSMFHFLNTDRPGLWSAFALNLAAHSLSAFEVLLVLWFLGASRSPLTALGGAVIPGNVGTYEGANIVILKLLGFQAATGRIYNICEAPSLSELAWQLKIAKQMNWTGKFVVLPRGQTPKHLLQSGNVAQHVVASSERIRTELGYEDLVEIEEAIRRTIAWEQRNPPSTLNPQQFDYSAEDAALANVP